MSEGVETLKTKDEKNNKKDTKKGPDLQIALCGNKELYLPFKKTSVVL